MDFKRKKTTEFTVLCLFRCLLAAVFCASLLGVTGKAAAENRFSVGPDVNVQEGNLGTRAVQFRITKSGDQPGAVSYRTENGTAVNTDQRQQCQSTSNDYEFQSGTVGFAAGETEKTVTINVCGDRLFEFRETFHLRIAPPDFTQSNFGPVIIERALVTATILDDDPPPELTVEPLAIKEGDDGSQDLFISLRLNAVSGKPVTVTYKLTDGGQNPATSGKTCGGNVDFVRGSGKITIPVGGTFNHIQVRICGDRRAEPGGETIVLQLSNPVNVEISKSPSLVLRIEDNDRVIGPITQVRPAPGPINEAAKSADKNVKARVPPVISALMFEGFFLAATSSFPWVLETGSRVIPVIRYTSQADRYRFDNCRDLTNAPWQPLPAGTSGFARLSPVPELELQVGLLDFCVQLQSGTGRTAALSNSRSVQVQVVRRMVHTTDQLTVLETAQTAGLSHTAQPLGDNIQCRVGGGGFTIIPRAEAPLLPACRFRIFQGRLLNRLWTVEGITIPFGPGDYSLSVESPASGRSPGMTFVLTQLRPSFQADCFFPFPCGSPTIRPAPGIRVLLRGPDNERWQDAFRP